MEADSFRTHMMRVLALLFLLICSATYAHASVLGDSTTIVKNQLDSVTLKVVLLLLEASEIGQEKPAEALQNYRKALNLTKVKDARWEADIRLAMGKLLYRLKSSDAMTQFLKADALYKKKSLLKGRAETLLEIAKIQQARGLSAPALINYAEVYRLQNKLGESVLAGNAALHSTDIFIKQQNYPEAFKSADMAKNAYYKVCRKDSLGSIYYRIASIKKNLKMPKSAEYYILSQALSYYRASDDLQGRLKSFDFLGQLYKEQKRYSEAKWFYLQANNQARVMNDTAALITSLVNLGVTKILIGDLALAKQDIAEADLLAQSDSVYLPIMKTAKVKNAVLFKKLNLPVTALSEVKKKKSTSVKKKTVLDIDSAIITINPEIAVEQKFQGEDTSVGSMKKSTTSAKTKFQEEITANEVKKKSAVSVKTKGEDTSVDAKKKTTVAVTSPSKEKVASNEVKKKPATPKPKAQESKTAIAAKDKPKGQENKTSIAAKDISTKTKETKKNPETPAKVKDDATAKKPVTAVKAKDEEPEPKADDEVVAPEISPIEVKEKRNSTYIFP
jgi:hypothetical protein